MATRRSLGDIDVYDETAGTPPRGISGLAYDDVERIFDDVEGARRELIDGELIVPPSPVPDHQRAVLVLGARMLAYAQQRGGHVFPAPLDVYLGPHDVVQPDLVYLRAENAARVGDRYIKGAPDVVVEVSSPSTRRLDTVRKRGLYERFGVPEYWYVDLETKQVVQHRLDKDHAYGPAVVQGPADVVSSEQMPGLEVAGEELLGSTP